MLQYCAPDATNGPYSTINTPGTKHRRVPRCDALVSEVLVVADVAVRLIRAHFPAVFTPTSPIILCGVTSLPADVAANVSARSIRVRVSSCPGAKFRRMS